MEKRQGARALQQGIQAKRDITNIASWISQKSNLDHHQKYIDDDQTKPRKLNSICY
jgi:hypothetical protein